MSTTTTTTTRVTLANRTLAKKNNIKTTISNCSPIVSKNSHKIWCIIKVQAIVRRWLAINRYKKMKLEFLKKKQLSSNSSSSNLTCSTINIHSSPQLENDQSVNNNNNNTDDIVQTPTTEVELETTTTPPPIEISQSSPKLSVSTSASISNSASTSSSSISSIDDYIASLGIKDSSDNEDESSSYTDSDCNEKVKENVQVIAPVIQVEEIVKEKESVVIVEVALEEPVEEPVVEEKQEIIIKPITPITTNTTPITSRSSSVSSTISMSSSLSSSSLSSSVSDSSTSSNAMCNSSSSLSSSINSSTEKSSPMYQRKRTLDEMLKVERGYVTDMTTLIEVFLKPFRDVDTFFPKNHLYTLFCNIEELKDLHQQFLNDMEKKFEPTNGKPADLAIGDLFLPFMGSFQKLYESYINNYEKAFALTRYFKINPNYQEIQKSIYQKEKDTRCRHLDFNSFLVIPIQRLPRYIVLLKEIEKNTPQSDPDFNFIALSLVQLQDLTLYLNESKRKSSFSDKVDEIKSNVFGASAIIGNSKYIMEGQLSLLKGVVASTKKDLFIYLFKDCIICTETNVNYGTKDNNGGGNGSNSSSPNNNLTPKKQVLKSLTTSASTPNNLSTSSFSTSSTSSSSSSPNSTLTHSTSSGASSGSPLSTLHNSSNSSSSSNNYSKIIFKTIHFSDIKAVSILKNFKDSFQVVSQKKVYTFVAPSTEIRQRWIDMINDCVNNITPPPSPTIPRSSRFATLSPKGRNRNSVNLSTSAEK